MKCDKNQLIRTKLDKKLMCHKRNPPQIKLKSLAADFFARGLHTRAADARLLLRQPSFLVRK